MIVKSKQRPKGKCFDCLMPYKEFPCDMVIQNDLWEVISPSYDYGAGLLCPNCICKRIMSLGVTRVLVTVDTSELIKGEATR